MNFLFFSLIKRNISWFLLQLTPTCCFVIILSSLSLGAEVGGWERLHPSPKNDELSSIASSSSLVLGVGEKGLVQTSSDGITWNLQDYPTVLDLFDVTWGNDEFLVVGEDGSIFSTADGVEWTEKNSGSRRDLRNVFWTGSEYVVIGEYSTVLKSPDGDTWTSHNISQHRFGSESTKTFYVKNDFYLSDQGTNLTSQNGIDWRDSTLPRGLDGLLWTGTEYLFIHDGNNFVSWSVDGENWMKRFAPLGTNAKAMASNGNVIVIVGYEAITSSTDGQEWESHTAGAAGNWKQIIWTGHHFVARSVDGMIATSPDGSNWRLEDSFVPEGGVIAYGNGRYVTIGIDTGFERSQAVAFSKDGDRWTPKYSTTFRSGDIDYFLGKFVIAGGDRIFTSQDGLEWEFIWPKATRESFPWPQLKQITNIARGKNLFVGLGTGGAIYSSESDLENWIERVSGGGNSRDLRDVEWLGNQFVAVGNSGSIVSSPDGIDWTIVDSKITGELLQIAYSNQTYVAVGTNHILTSSDAVTWEIAGPSSFSNYFTSVVWTGEKFVVAGNEIYSSPDGIEWTSQPIKGDNLAYVRQANERLFHLSYELGFLEKDNDGNWTSQKGFANVELSDIAFDGNQYIAVGEKGEILQSTNGTGWSALPSGITADLYSVVWTGQDFIATAGEGMILKSKDGKEWEIQKPEADALFRYHGAALGNNTYVVVNGLSAYSSSDGSTWKKNDQYFNSEVTQGGLIWTGDRFIAISREGNVHLSTDGQNWTSKQIIDPPADLVGIASSGEQIAIVAEDGRILVSEKGLEWDLVPLAGEEAATDIIWTGKDFLVFGPHSSRHLKNGRISRVEKMPSRGFKAKSAVWDGKRALVVGEIGADLWDRKRGLVLSYRPVVPESYANWTVSEGLPESHSAPEDDANGDGLSNLVAFALGINASKPLSKDDFANLPTVATKEDSSIQFSLPLARSSDIRYSIETSSQLSPDSWAEVAWKETGSEWNGDLSVREIFPHDQSDRVVVYAAKNPAKDGKSFFLRVRVEFAE